MIYRSNLSVPDLQPFFRHAVCRVMGHSRGHDVLSDFADKPANCPVFGIYKQAGMMTHDEAAILYSIAQQVGGTWLDIGGLTGWTAAHLAIAGCVVRSIDPMYANAQFRARAEENLTAAGVRDKVTLWACTSDFYFEKMAGKLDGVVIDGEHSAPGPSLDAHNARERVTERGVIVFHDTCIYAVRKAYHACGNAGWKSKAYTTPHGVAICYRNGFSPPEHTPDPRVA